jgi:phage-related protein
LQKRYIAVAWTVEFLDQRVIDELKIQPREIRAKFERIMNKVEAAGLERVGWPHIAHVEGQLWEMRLQGKDRIARALYVTATGHRVVVVRVFTKKTQKTPRREIELALARAAAVK